jgi:hypothetical protein
MEANVGTALAPRWAWKTRSGLTLITPMATMDVTNDVMFRHHCTSAITSLFS